MTPAVFFYSFVAEVFYFRFRAGWWLIFGAYRHCQESLLFQTASLVSLRQHNIGYDRRAGAQHLDFDLVSGFVLTQCVGEIV